MMKRIIVGNVSKKFRIGYNKNQNLFARFISAFSGKEPKKIFWALKDVSFNIGSGEIVGIIGKNGSGKSTLLRIIAGIYEADKGEVKTNGRICSAINVGFYFRLTMRDTIYLCCSLYGLNQKAIKHRFNSIVGFAELGAFVNTKLYQFSSGMIVRLLSSIVLHCDSDILLLDDCSEIIDEQFRNKVRDRVSEIIKKGATCLMVSHDHLLLKKYCNRVIWIDKGKIIRVGKPKLIIEDYRNY